MASNPSDKAALNSLSRPEDKKLFEKALATIKTESVAEAFRVAHPLASASADERLVECVTTFTQSRLIKASEFLFVKHRTLFCDLSASQMIACAPTTKSINEWAGKAETAVTRRQELMKLAVESPGESIASALALWFVESCSEPQLKVSASFVLAALDAKPYFPASELLRGALRRDADGGFTASLLALASQEVGAAQKLADEFQAAPELVESLIEPLAKAARTSRADGLISFVRGVFGRMDKSPAEASQRGWSASVLSLASHAMRCPDSPGIRNLLTELHSLSLSLSFKNEGTTQVSNLCGIRFLGSAEATETGKLNERGARLLALTFDHLKQGEDPILTLEATALNLGMKQIAKLGDVVSFEPRLHEDVCGGLIKGERAEVVSCGWELNGCVIERATVKPV